MKKILLITLEYPPQEGGVASYYSGVVQELKRRGYEVEVVSDDGIYPHNPLKPPLNLRGGRSFLLFRFIWPRWLKAYFVVRKQIKKNRPDLILVGNILPLGTVAYLLRKRVPYMVLMHGMDILIAQKSWRKKKLSNRVLRFAKLVIANSEFTKQSITKLSPYGGSPVGREIITVYPCPNISGQSDTEAVNLLRRKIGIVGKRVILTLGRVVQRKGHDSIIKSLPEIIKHFPDVVYIIAGAGPYLEPLAEMVKKLHLETSVRFVGKVSNAERAAYYAACDLFAMPSRQIGPDVEGFGIVFLEAALFGKPSIGGRSGGIAEAILHGQTGLLVDPEDSAAVARDIVQLLRDDTLRNELGQNAKARVLHEFTWEKQVGVLINTIDRNS